MNHGLWIGTVLLALWPLTSQSQGAYGSPSAAAPPVATPGQPPPTELPEGASTTERCRAALAHGGKTLPPIMRAMDFTKITMSATLVTPEGARMPLGRGVPMRMRIHRGVGMPSDHKAVTQADGTATFDCIPKHPSTFVQQKMKYQASATYRGVRYNQMVIGLPYDGAHVEVDVRDSKTTGLEYVYADSSVELVPDEDHILVIQRVTLVNTGPSVINCAALPRGGLVISAPEDAKQAQLKSGKKDRRFELRGMNVFFKGALVPESMSRGVDPIKFSLTYVIPYRSNPFEWKQTFPVRRRNLEITTVLGDSPTLQVPNNMYFEDRDGHELSTGTMTGPRGRTVGYGLIEPMSARNAGTLSETERLRNFMASEPVYDVRFAVGGVPIESKLPNQLLIVALVIVTLVVLFGFRRREGDTGLRLSMSHLESERDRLVRILARMRKAKERGKLSEVRYEKEQEAITARLVSLYRAIDRLKEN